jgi:hypothetical protein
MTAWRGGEHTRDSARLSTKHVWQSRSVVTINLWLWSVLAVVGLFVSVYIEKDVLVGWCDCLASKWILRNFTSPPSKTKVSRSSFPTQCYVDVHKAELYVWIIQIIADNSERHVCVSVQWRCRLRLLPSSAFVTDAGSIILQMPWNRKSVTQKEKKIIEAYALSQNASCFETVARVILLLTS